MRHGSKFASGHALGHRRDASNQFQSMIGECFEIGLVHGRKPGLMENGGGGNQAVEPRAAPSSGLVEQVGSQRRFGLSERDDLGLQNYFDLTCLRRCDRAVDKLRPRNRACRKRFT